MFALRLVRDHNFGQVSRLCLSSKQNVRRRLRLNDEAAQACWLFLCGLDLFLDRELALCSPMGDPIVPVWVVTEGGN